MSDSEGPGMTRYISTEDRLRAAPVQSMPTIAENLQKPVAMFATATITDENLFSNGLFQNIYLFYRMFEAMGWSSRMLVNKLPDNKAIIPSYMSDLKMVEMEEFVKHPYQVKVYIEIGMSIEDQMRRFLRMCGAKCCKLYLGNILNIDIETPIFYPAMHFAHHVIGELDEIWVSPHYYQHAQYARAMNHCPLEKPSPMVVPYIWDPQILTANGERRLEWRAAEKPEDEVFLILEPNISFQKSSLIALMMIERWYRSHPEWKGKVILINGERLELIPFTRDTVFKNLKLWKDKRIEIKGRMDIVTLLKTYPSAIPVCHQVNNEYNYMVLEFFWAKFPVIHNASDWAAYGYYYKNSSLSEGVNCIEKIRGNHSQNLQIYEAHAKALQWRHSPYNPEVQRQWLDILKASGVKI
jgi:hypothetical protein